MGRLIIIIFFFIAGITANAQDTSFHNNKHISVQGNNTDFEVDNIGNIYLIINNEQLKKIDSNGDSLAVYNDIKRYGRIALVDVSNPFKILVLYKDASTIVVLDGLLNVKNIIDLRKSHIQQVKSIRLSYDNNIWLYDEAEGKIRKIDDNGKILLESVDLRNAFADAPSFESISDDNKSLYLYDPKLGWFIFDYYGAFTKKYAFLNWKDTEVANGIMTGRRDSSFLFVKQGDFDFKMTQPGFSIFGITKMHLKSRHIYVLFPGKLEIYNAP